MLSPESATLKWKTPYKGDIHSCIHLLISLKLMVPFLQSYCDVNFRYCDVSFFGRSNLTSQKVEQKSTKLILQKFQNLSWHEFILKAIHKRALKALRMKQRLKSFWWNVKKETTSLSFCDCNYASWTFVCDEIFVQTKMVAVLEFAFEHICDFFHL